MVEKWERRDEEDFERVFLFFIEKTMGFETRLWRQDAKELTRSFFYHPLHGIEDKVNTSPHPLFSTHFLPIPQLWDASGESLLDTWFLTVCPRDLFKRCQAVNDGFVTLQDGHNGIVIPLCSLSSSSLTKTTPTNSGEALERDTKKTNQ